MVDVTLTINGTTVSRSTTPRRLLSDFIREDLGYTGTHVGCEHGYCGACTILVDGEPARACLMLAVQADGLQLETVESLAPSPDALHEIQQAFQDNHGLQCGFCTPGMLMTAKALLADNATPTEEEVREQIAGNLCRCTGYSQIVDAILSVGPVVRETP
ncbi:MAG: (2Fe-2S)-binding protein [Actinobacteria bacterium]|nr:(2Fe-2S)-binding protein [Actinomycetota bacterium]